MNNKRILFLMGENARMYSKYQNQDIVFSSIYKCNIPSVFLRLFRNNEVLVKYIVESWVKYIDTFDTIVIFDTEATVALLKWISKHYKKKHIIFYYRNSIEAIREKRSVILPEKVKELGYDLWSYNIHDCKKYHMKYNSQVVQKEYFITQSDIEVVYDVFFAGLAKGREEYLINLEQKLHQKGKNTFFYIPDLKSYENNKCKDGARLKYKDYIVKIKESNVLIDIVNEKNYGLTMRPLEALFSKRKLITNYKDIIYYDFYRPENIYILDEDCNLDKIEDFLDKPYIDIEQKIVNNYDVNNWVERFSIE